MSYASVISHFHKSMLLNKNPMLDIQVTPFKYVVMVHQTLVKEPLTVKMDILIKQKVPGTCGNLRKTKLYLSNNQP